MSAAYDVAPADAAPNGPLREGDLDDGCLSVAGAAGFAGVGRTTLYAAITAGALATVKVGRRRLVPRRALVRWLAGAS